jgi:hypothetical protein
MFDGVLVIFFFIDKSKYLDIEICLVLRSTPYDEDQNYGINNAHYTGIDRKM